MRYLSMVVILFTVVIVLIRCTSTTKPVGTTKPIPPTVPPPDPPTGNGGSENFFANRWVLVEVEGQPVTPSGDNREAHLLFYPGQVSQVKGSTGCNSLTGTFELSGANNIKFSPLATTKMMCAGSSNEVETKFLSALHNANNYYITSGNLLLLNGKILVAKLKAATSASASKWSGKWELNYISGRRIAFEGLYPEKKPHISFDLSKNEVNGHTSCNPFSSKFTVAGNKISFSDPTAMTMMVCEGEGEKSFLQILKTVNKYEFLNDQTLSLQMGDVIVMRFIKK